MKEDINEALLIRYVLDEADVIERQQVESWMHGNVERTRRVEQTSFLLNNSKRMALSSPLTEDEAWEKFKNKRDETAPAPVRRLSRWLQAAAAVLVIAAGSWVAWYYGHAQKSQWATLSTNNKVVIDTLPDGSVVQLNKHSAISFSNRVVRLNGEAFFKVVHEAGKPFRVYTRDVVITDIGTAFNVKADADKVEVIVESGTVNVRTKANSIILKQKQMVLVEHKNTVALKADASTDLLYQYYRTNEFVTDHTPLSRLVKVLNEAYGVNIVVEGNSLAELPITGTYKKESLDKILEVLMMTSPQIHRIDQDGKIILTR